jgi:hypothetical protein
MPAVWYLTSEFRKLAVDRKQTGMLEQYWERCREKPDALGSKAATDMSSPLVTPAIPIRPGRGHTRNRSLSDGTALLPPGHKLSSYHPARGLTSLLDMFGPLIFPIHRAALLRKRVLISCHAPVHEICNFGRFFFSMSRPIIVANGLVYDLSVLSNIPQSVADLLPPQAPTHRLRPLFTIGVHDIPLLMQDADASKPSRDVDSAVVDEAPTGWIACTTDSILAMKDTLYDMLITMPPPCSPNAAQKQWPSVECPHGKPIRATQRDLRRFRALKAGLARIITATTPGVRPDTPASESSALARPSTGTTLVGDASEDSLDQVIEPTTWAALAYSGFMWWASAGEQRRSDEHDEAVHDASLLSDLAPRPTMSMSMSMSMPSPTLPGSRLSQEILTDSITSLSGARPPGSLPDDEARVELAIIAYFHRLTTDILCVIGEAVDSEATESDVDAESDRDGSEDALLLRDQVQVASRPIRLDSHAFELMGLDVWSAADGDFLRDLTEMYFGRRVHIEGKGIEVCGIRVC